MDARSLVGGRRWQAVRASDARRNDIYKFVEYHIAKDNRWLSMPAGLGQSGVRDPMTDSIPDRGVIQAYTIGRSHEKDTVATL